MALLASDQETAQRSLTPDLSSAVAATQSLPGGEGGEIRAVAFACVVHSPAVVGAEGSEEGLQTGD